MFDNGSQRLQNAAVRTTVQVMARPPVNYPDPQIDSFTRNVRAVFGALLGAAAFVVFWLRWGPFSGGQVVLGLLASIVACVVGSVRYGDAFWHGFLRMFRHR